MEELGVEEGGAVGELSVEQVEVGKEQAKVEVEEQLLEGTVEAFDEGGFLGGARVSEEVFEAHAVEGRFELPGELGAVVGDETKQRGRSRGGICGLREERVPESLEKLAGWARRKMRGRKT